MSTGYDERSSHIEKDDVGECLTLGNEEKTIENNLETKNSCADCFEAYPGTCSTTDNQIISSYNDSPNENLVQGESSKCRTNSYENCTASDTNCDSGLDTMDSAFPISDSETDVTPLVNLSSDGSPNSLNKSNAVTDSNSSSPAPSEENVAKETIKYNYETNETNSCNKTKDITTNSSTQSLQTLLNNTDIGNINHSLTVSTVSLNGHDSVDRIANVSLLSRSCDNLTKYNDDDSKTNTRNEDLINADRILSEFSDQKTKATAVQKIPETGTNTHPRLQKEILNQDVGSIVKNVQGIFSSVSGSLKYAYGYRTPKPVKSVKPIPNGKIMSEIFEDEVESIDVKSTENPTKSVDVKSVDTSDLGTLRTKMEILERVLVEQRDENALLKDRLRQQRDETNRKDNAFKELEAKMDLLSKRLEQADREKDAAVMRYASVECAHIEAKRAAEKAAKSEKCALNEVELLNNKLRSAAGEKTRICQLYDDKCHEVQKNERQVSKLREDLRELEGRLKWTQSKLRMEMDAYRESSERAEKLSAQVSELEAAKGAAAAQATDSIRAKHLETELKESQAALILCRHEKDELEKRLSTMRTQLDICSREREAAIDSLARTSAEVTVLRESKLRLEEEAAELAALRAQAALADVLSAQLQRETVRADEAEHALSAERARAETCGRREAAALEHAAALTQQHVAERAAAHKHRATAQALELDNASLRDQVAGLRAECEGLQRALDEEIERRNKENRVLARKVAELTEEVAETNKKLEWEKGENGVLKKKHSSAIKEMNRELQRALKRCEQLEAKVNADAPSTRTGSVSSLTSGESAPQEESLQNGHADNVPDVQVREPDRQALVERVVSLQRALARRAERVDFLEEHARQLTAELGAKSRLLRALLNQLPAGAVASSRRDDNKKEIARLGGGAMAAVWGGDPGGMTLDLSLEMNRRLQAVLEDTLLKNITLKENMDTLGAEISRLKEQSKPGEPK
ncbi:coiled-coil domain-containing protein 186 isoform X2 [Bombyx mandarina]|uniref:Coiled-coil domain-containing protein 186 isoform X2 n=1 Tax=Bombyx mandarina TaxID=7092 RepID=A0A6J2JFD5_BOMMA|nr:coiled-coil domain-containing protein 186 isoform X2 [Bombyx mandarina]